MATDDETEVGGEEKKKSKLGLILAVVGGLVVLVAGVGGGVILGPKLLGSPPAAQAADGTAVEKPKGPPKAPEKIVSAKFDPLVIDLRGKRGEVHHLKVGLSAELADGVIEDDFKLVQPRGREAALTYLRTLTFDDVTNPKKYAKIKKDLSNKVTKAVGEERVVRILLIDFVAQ